jgi:hypothetical protein
MSRTLLTKGNEKIVVPSYPQVIHSKTCRGYVKPHIIKNAIYNMMFV